MSTIITLTTDFGTRDGYVGAMKGVILSLAPGATLVDVSHSVPPQDVRHGAHVLMRAAPYFPPGTVHLAVVDPGVGSARRGIAIATHMATFVGPDNGLFTPFLADRVGCVALTNPATRRQTVSTTFHGRDVFAPVAAHLAGGVPLSELGPEVTDPVALPDPQPRRLADGSLQGEIVYTDGFGNLVTNVKPAQWVGDQGDLQDVRVAVQDVTVEFHPTYAAVPSGSLLALVGSEGHLELSVRDGSAADRLGLADGARIKVWGL
jgi:S-adenosylmethionine hydrolase